MLVLSRKHGEAIVVGDDITVTILAVEGGRVKLGIVAPAEVPILRQELCEAALLAARLGIRRVCVTRRQL